MHTTTQYKDPGHFLIKMTGGGGGGETKTKVLPGTIQQLKMLPRADRKSHIWHPRANMIPHFDSPRVVK